MFDWDNPMAYVVTVGMWLVCMLVVWKMLVMGSLPTATKIILSIVSLPVLFVVVSFRLARDD